MRTSCNAMPGMALSKEETTVEESTSEITASVTEAETKAETEVETTATIETENCLVHTRDGRTYSGTVQTTFASQHVFPGSGSKERSEETMEIVLDEIVKTADDVKKLGIGTGCFISWDPRVQLTESGFLKSRHLDDKASSGIVASV